MATITHVFTINHVAEMLEEDPEFLLAIVRNSDNLTYNTAKCYFSSICIPNLFAGL